MAEEILKQVKFEINKVEAVRRPLNIPVRQDRGRALFRLASRGLSGAEDGGASGKTGPTSVKQRKRKDQ